MPKLNQTLILLIATTLASVQFVHSIRSLRIIDSNAGDVTKKDASLIERELKDDLMNLTRSLGDNLHIPHVPIDVTHPAFRIVGSMDNVTVSMHLDNVTIKFMHFNEGKIQLFNMTFNNISLKGDQYDINGNIGDLFEVGGKGPFWFDLIKFSVAVPFTRNNTHLFYNIDVNLLEFHCWFTNLMNDPELEDLFNRALQSIVPEAVVIIWGEIKDAILGNVAIENVVSKALFKLTNAQKMV